MNAGSLVCQALYWALPLCFVFHLLFQESGGNNYSAELSLNSRGGQVQWAQIIGHWPLCISLHVTSGRWSLHVTSGHWLLYVSLHVTSNRVLGVLLLAGNGVLWFYSMCVLLALVCVSQHFIVFYCSYSIQFREPVWTCLKQLSSTKREYVVSMT